MSSLKSFLFLLLLYSGFDTCSAGSTIEQSSNPLYTLTGTTPHLIWTYTNPPSDPDTIRLLYGSTVDSDGFISTPEVIGALVVNGRWYLQDGSFLGRLTTSWSGNTINITMKDVDLNDTMYYAVELKKGTKPLAGMTSKGLQLFVQVPVEMMDLSSNKTTQEHNKVSFECQASGHPPPEMIWTKLGETEILSKTQTIETQQLSTILVKSTLTFESVKRSDPGMYQCNATNGVKNSFVNKHLLSLTYKSNIRTSCKHMGDYYILLCEVIQSDSTILEYGFNTDVVSGIQISSSPAMILLAQDQTWWRCQAKNMQGWGGLSAMTKTEDCVKDNPSFRTQEQKHVVEECSCATWKALFGIMSTIFIILALAAFFIIYKKEILRFLKGEKYTESSPPLTGNTPPGGYRVNGFTNETNNLELRQRQNRLDTDTGLGLNAVQCNIPDTVDESEWEGNDPDAV